MMEQNLDHEYLWEDGLAEFNECAISMLYGKDYQHRNRIAKIQALSGTGSLRTGMEFLAKFLPKDYGWLNFRQELLLLQSDVEEPLPDCGGGGLQGARIPLLRRRLERLFILRVWTSRA